MTGIGTLGMGGMKMMNGGPQEPDEGEILYQQWLTAIKAGQVNNTTIWNMLDDKRISAKRKSELHSLYLRIRPR